MIKKNVNLLILALFLALFSQTVHADKNVPKAKVRPNYYIIQTDNNVLVPTIHKGDVYIQIGFKAPPETAVDSTLVRKETIDYHRIRYLKSPVKQPVKNICFVIDISGSMNDPVASGTGQRKIDWVKEAFKGLISADSFGTDDVISVVVFNDVSTVIIQPRSIKNEADRQQCINQINQIIPHDGTSILQGLTSGYQQIDAARQLALREHPDGDYINRIVLLSDGKDGQGRAILDLIESHKGRDVNIDSTISTLALDEGVDKELMRDIALAGDGIPLFFDGSETIEELTYYIERLMVSDLKEFINIWQLNIRITLADGVFLHETPSEYLAEITVNGKDIICNDFYIRADEYRSILFKVSLTEEAILKNDILQFVFTSENGIFDAPDKECNISLVQAEAENTVGGKTAVTTVYYAYPE
jgi:Mg-chelatase subunit ChlD